MSSMDRAPFTNGEIAARHLTGRVRHRQGWFGRLILEVEIRAPQPAYPRPPQPPGEIYDPWRFGAFTYWRDATLADLQALGELSSVLSRKLTCVAEINGKLTPEQRRSLRTRTGATR